MTENTGLQGYNYLDNYKEIKAVMDENLSGERMFLSSLDKIKVPAGGAKSWEVETLNGTEYIPELQGVILHEQKARAFWFTKYDESGGGVEPDCQSEDLITGVGSPGGQCATCPYGQFDPITNEPPKCREGRHLYFLTKNGALPVKLNLPPSSLKGYREFKMRLANALVPLSSIEVLISLEPDKSSKGVPYSKCVFRAGVRVTPEQKALLVEQSETMKTMLAGRSGPAELPSGQGQNALAEGGEAQALESDTGM